MESVYNSEGCRSIFGCSNGGSRISCSSINTISSSSIWGGAKGGASRISIDNRSSSCISIVVVRSAVLVVVAVTNL